MWLNIYTVCRSRHDMTRQGMTTHLVENVPFAIQIFSIEKPTPGKIPPGRVRRAALKFFDIFSDFKNSLNEFELDSPDVCYL